LYFLQIIIILDNQDLDLRNIELNKYYKNRKQLAFLLDLIKFQLKPKFTGDPLYQDNKNPSHQVPHLFSNSFTLSEAQLNRPLANRSSATSTPPTLRQLLPAICAARPRTQHPPPLHTTIRRQRAPSTVAPRHGRRRRHGRHGHRPDGHGRLHEQQPNSIPSRPAALRTVQLRLHARLWLRLRRHRLPRLHVDPARSAGIKSEPPIDPMDTVRLCCHSQRW
jgi:hypothetical protein